MNNTQQQAVDTNQGVLADYDLASELPTLAELEKRHILNAIALSDGNKTKAAKILGVSLKTIYNKLHQYMTEPKVTGN